MVGNHAGAHVYSAMRTGALEARRRADAAASVANRARAELDAITRERLQAVQQLARTQLPELTSATASTAWPDAAAEMLQFEQQRQARTAELQREIAEVEEARREADEVLQQATNALDVVVARRDELLDRVATSLAEDADYSQQQAAATQAEVGLARDLERAEELASEAKTKLPPYESSRLFQYLWARKFGTPEYTSTGFTRRMDRRLAEFIGYSQAVGSYRFLKTTPKFVRLQVEQRTGEVRSMRAALSAREDKERAAVGLPAVFAEGDALGKRREQALADVQAVQQRSARAYAALRDEAGARGAFHEAALRRLTEYLERAETTVLERRARATPDPADDALVSRIRAATADLSRVAVELPALDAEARRLDHIADGLEDLLARFRHSEYDSGRSYFTMIDPQDLLRGVQDGRIGYEDFWGQLANSHRFRQTQIISGTHDTASVLKGVGFALRIAGAVADIAMSSGSRSHHTSSSSSPSSGGFSSGGGFGGFGGGGFSSGGGIGGGGGFTSGKGF
jgi:hypothetical protein